MDEVPLGGLENGHRSDEGESTDYFLESVQARKEKHMHNSGSHWPAENRSEKCCKWYAGWGQGSFVPEPMNNSTSAGLLNASTNVLRCTPNYAGGNASRRPEVVGKWDA